jgi:hypothetical protein
LEVSKDNKNTNPQEVAIKAEHLPIYRMEEALRNFPQVEIPLFHDFCKGIYARTIIIPAGTVLTGAVHKDECFFLVRNGAILITTDNEPIKAETGYMSITKPDTKRAGFALVDTMVTTFHSNPDELRDPQEIWDTFTIPAPENLLEVLANTELEA